MSLVAHAQVPDYVPTEGWWRGILSMGMRMMRVGMGITVKNTVLATLMIDLMAVRWLLHAVNPNSQLGCSYQLN